MNLWRIHLIPGPGRAQGRNVPEFCFKRNVVGIGWPVESAPSSKEDYLKQCWKKYPKSRKGSVSAFLNDMQENDLVWTRKDMNYYLGKVGCWEYRDDNEHYVHHIFNVRSHEWILVGSDTNVPGAVVTSFIKGPTVRKLGDPRVLDYSRYIYAKKKPGEPPVARPKDGKDRILALFPPEDLEDVVALYLQVVKRCIILPSTCKKGTPTVEGFGVSMEDGALIGWQVKSGQSTINEKSFGNFNGRVYLFQLAEWPDAAPNPPCIRLTADELRQFLFDPAHERLMPEKIKNWLDYVIGS